MKLPYHFWIRLQALNYFTPLGWGVILAGILVLVALFS